MTWQCMSALSPSNRWQSYKKEMKTQRIAKEKAEKFCRIKEFS